MANKPDVTIIIPAYNGKEGITDVITQLKQLSKALKTDIRNAAADVVLFRDADGQHKLGDIQNSYNILQNMI